MSEIENSPRHRLKIYVLLGTRANLEPTGGDVINEARFLETLTQFADVYYNGTLFRPGEPNFGLTATTVDPPEPVYDLYYVRNNPAIFAACPHPKIAMAYPYDEDIFRTADALFVTTDGWMKGLLPYSPDNPYSNPIHHWYGSSIVEPPRLINIKQTVDPRFLEPVPEEQRLEARARMTMARAIGFFGRIEGNTFPTMFLAAYKRIIADVPDLKFVVAGTVRIPLDRTILRLPRLPYEKMPALVSGCIGTASDEGNDAFFLGSGKVLDSMAQGVPVIAYKTPPRLEQLGEEYPLYYDNEQECYARIRELLYDKDIVAECKRQVRERIRLFLPTTRAMELREQLEKLATGVRASNGVS